MLQKTTKNNKTNKHYNLLSTHPVLGLSRPSHWHVPSSRQIWAKRRLAKVIILFCYRDRKYG